MVHAGTSEQLHVSSTSSSLVARQGDLTEMG